MSIANIAETAAHLATDAAQQEMPQMPAPESIGRFELLMQQPLAEPVGITGHSGAGSEVIDAINRQDSQMHAVFQQIVDLNANVGSMGITQQIEMSGQVSLNLSLAQFDFQTKMAVVDASKSSAETLMKNQ